MDRTSGGLFAEGNKIAKGRPPGVFSTFSDTAGRLLEELGRAEIIAISDDEERLNTFPAFQCLVIRQLAAALKSKDGDIDLTVERERLYDRTIGKPALPAGHGATVNITNITLNLSQTNSFLADLTGGGETVAISGDVQERPLLSAPLRTE